jgi:integrase/recombinase XerD
MDKKNFAVLYPLNRDLQKTWFVKYRVPDFKTGTYVYKKYKGQLNRLSTLEERMQDAERIIFCIENKIPLQNLSGIRAPREQMNHRGFANIPLLLHQSVDARFACGELEHISHIAYRSKIRVFEGWMFTSGRLNTPFGAFTISHAKEFLSYLKSQKKYANGYINDIKALLFTCWKSIIAEHEIKNVINPWADLKSLPKKAIPFRKLTVEIEKKISETLPDFDLQLYILSQFIYYDFIRVTELTKMKLHHIEWDKSEITVPENISRKSKKDRTLVIPEQLMNLLIDHGYHLHNQEHYIFSPSGTPGEKMVSKNHFSRLFKAYRTEHGIPSDYKLYGFKHTGNSKLASIGVNAQLQQKHNGHASLDYTQRYTSLSKDDVAFLKHRFPTFGQKGKSLYGDDTGMELPKHIMEKLIHLLKNQKDVI